ncbi:hypothetical protein CPB97_002642 [Podila verticillata]|nr:hypothetical protein CPB97_002642 [Podila verticillata]
MADHAELIANFVVVSGATPEQAQFYPRPTTGTSTFYEEPQAGAASGGRDNRGTSHVDEDNDEDLDDVLAQSALKSASKK